MSFFCVEDVARLIGVSDTTVLQLGKELIYQPNTLQRLLTFWIMSHIIQGCPLERKCCL